MNISENPVFGQYSVNIDGTECRIVLCPDVPIDEKDDFLARTYQRAVKETTVKNMYSRWLNATGPLIKSKKFDLVCNVYSVYSFALHNPNAKFNMGPVALAARNMNVVQTVVKDFILAADVYFTDISIGHGSDDFPQNILLQAVIPHPSDLRPDWFTTENIVSLIDKL